MSVTAQKRARVRRRARQMREYCRLPQRASILLHQVDHIVAQQHLGTDEESNLCLCCLRGNHKKGPNIASVDPESAETYALMALVHPRKQRWREHFQLQEDGCIVGTTPEGRATARLLDFNDVECLQLRRVLIRHGWKP